MNKKFLLIDVDSKIPNLALMKISAWLKSRRDKVILKRGGEIPIEAFSGIDGVYISCIFSWNKSLVEELKSKFSCSVVEAGGVGWGNNKLPSEIEHLMPDYDLYGADFSMGFTSRGCSRSCEFCNVPQFEGMLRDHAHPKEFIHSSHEKVVLLDNNFVLSPNFERNLRYIRGDLGLKLSITQGIDARATNKEKAEILAKYWPYYNMKFKETTLYTAWDRLKDEEKVLRGIQNLIDAGIPTTKIMPYVLVGFNTTLDEDLYRFNRLLEMGVRPYVMPYNNEPHPMKRWGNRPIIYTRIPFKEYHRLREEGIGHPEEVYRPKN